MNPQTSEVETICLSIPSPRWGSAATHSSVGAQDIQAGGKASCPSSLLNGQHANPLPKTANTIPRIIAAAVIRQAYYNVPIN